MCTAPQGSQCGYGCTACTVPRGGGKPTCTKCGDGLALVNGKCQPLKNYNAYCNYSGTKCFGCPVSYEFRNGTCINSSPHCDYTDTINDASKCLACKIGYGPKQGMNKTTRWVLGGCVRCADPRCTLCDGKSTTCTTCRDGFAAQSGKCVACPKNCRSCRSPSSCLSCEPGYARDAKGACAKCTDPNCEFCSPNVATCVSCNIGFNAINGTCVACKRRNCKYCLGDVMKCSVCQPGWGLGETGACDVKCATSTGEPKCLECSTSPTVCEACRDGSFLYFDTQGQRRCLACKVQNCKKCAHPTKCAECSDGYELQQNGTCAKA